MAIALGSADYRLSPTEKVLLDSTDLEGKEMSGQIFTFLEMMSFPENNRFYSLCWDGNRLLPYI